MTSRLIQPQEIEIDGKKFTISKFPPIEGREIVSKYVGSNMPKIGDYAISEAMMYKIMKYVEVNIGGTPVILETHDLINSHVGNFEILIKLEIAVLEYNISFLGRGGISNFFQNLLQTIPQWISKTLMDLLAQSSAKEKLPSMNSEQSTV